MLLFFLIKGDLKITQITGDFFSIRSSENIQIGFFFFFLAALGLRGCLRAFSSCGKWASHCGDFSCCGARAPGSRAQ